MTPKNLRAIHNFLKLQNAPELIKAVALFLAWFEASFAPWRKTFERVMTPGPNMTAQDTAFQAFWQGWSLGMLFSIYGENSSDESREAKRTAILQFIELQKEGYLDWPVLEVCESLCIIYKDPTTGSISNVEINEGLLAEIMNQK